MAADAGEPVPQHRTAPVPSRMRSHHTRNTTQTKEVDELQARLLQEADDFITCDPTGRYDGTWKPEGHEDMVLPAITFWQEKIKQKNSLLDGWKRSKELSRGWIRREDGSFYNEATKQTRPEKNPPYAYVHTKGKDRKLMEEGEKDYPPWEAIDNPRPIRVKFSVKRFNDINVVDGCFGIKMNMVSNYPMTKKEYENYREWEQEQLLKEAADVNYKRPQVLPDWVPDLRAENFLDGETNEEDNDQVDYNMYDPWLGGPKKVMKGGKGLYHHPETAQLLSTGGKGDVIHNLDSTNSKEKNKKKRILGFKTKPDENNIDEDGKQWHEPPGMYAHVSFRKDWTGTFSELMEVDNFPFDCQDMTVILKDKKESKILYYLPNNLDKGKPEWNEKTKQWSNTPYKKPKNFGKIQKNTSSITGWEFTRALMEFTNSNPHDSTKLKKYPLLYMRFKFARKWLNLFLALWLPLLISWILVCFTWMLDPLTYDRDDGGTTIGNMVQSGAGGDRLGYLSGLLLTVVAFIPAIQEKLPDVPYQTWIDEYLLTVLMFMVFAILVQALNAPGINLIEHRGVYAHVGMGLGAGAYTFIPNNMDCCVQIPSFLSAFPSEIQAANTYDGNTWRDIVKYDDLQIQDDLGMGELLSTALDPYCTNLFLGANYNAFDAEATDAETPTSIADRQTQGTDASVAEATTWKSDQKWAPQYWVNQATLHATACANDADGAPYEYNPDGTIINPTAECATSTAAYAALLDARITEVGAIRVPTCYGHAGYAKWVDNVIFVVFTVLTVVMNVFFLVYAWYVRGKEREKLTADTVMLAEILGDEGDSNMLYGHMSKNASRWYPGGVKDINHGEEMEVYLITSSYVKDETDGDANVIHKRGDIKLDEMTQNFPALTQDALAKIRLYHKDYEVVDGAIVHEGASDMGARINTLTSMDLVDYEEVIEVDLNKDGMIGDGIAGPHQETGSDRLIDERRAGRKPSGREPSLTENF